MRSRQLLVATMLLVLAGCSDVTKPTSVLQPPSAARYQLSATGTLDAEIQALIAALFPTGLETATGVRWDAIKSKLQPMTLDVANARARLLDLTDWINKKQSQMDPPPAGETRAAASARLILYMSLYVYSGPTTPVPASFGPGADAVAVIVSPTTTTVLQTPSLHAAATFDPGTVAENSIVVVSQNTQAYRHCEGPLATKYCQYPLYYHYQVFPAQRFLKLVHVAVCHVPTGGNYGPLPAVDHSKFVIIHDKPAAISDYTPGGYPVPGENVEVLPRNTAFSGPAKVSCGNTVYPQVSYFTVPRNPQGFFENARALAVRAVNGGVRTVGSMLAPETLYAIDNGEEHNTLAFSSFLDADTLGHPDLQASSSSLPSQVVTPGQPLNLTYTVVNNGTAPSPVVTTVIQLQPASGSPITLTPSPALSWSGPLYPLEAAHTETAALTLPATMAPGTYTLSARVTSVGGLSETVVANNSAAVTLTVAPYPPPTLGVLILGPTMSAASLPSVANEQTLAEAAGLTVTVASPSTWALYSAADFAKYNAIVFGDPTCVYNVSPYAAAEANKATWSPVVTGPAIVIGTDPVFHQSQPGVQARELITNGIKYAASGATTGLYATLGCSYDGVANGTVVTFLSGVGAFTVGGTHAIDVHILLSSDPAMALLTNAGLSNWGFSAHALFGGSLSSYPNTFRALAEAGQPSSGYYPYIIAR